jgi:signal transduction histidine kinase
MAEDRLTEVVQLVRRIRHDAAGPLTAALGNVQLLLEDPAVKDAEVLDILRTVERELRRLADLLRELNAVRAVAPGSETEKGSA